jgi:hypothetical protein
VSALRGAWADLVEKRLWPVAVALVLAVVAIPALMLDSPAQPTPAPPAVANAGPAPLVTDPASIASARPSGPVVGEARNPFDQQHVPAKASTQSSGGAAAAAVSGDGSALPAGGSGGSGVGNPPSSGGGTGSKPKPAPSGEPRIKVRFGPTEGTRKVRTLSEGTPLPSVSNPAVVFVKVGSAKKIEFIVSSDAVAQGDGTCKPSKAICAQLFLHAGDTEFFDVTKSSGEVVQYQLDVLDVIE